MYINRMLKSVIDQRFSHILIVGDFTWLSHPFLGMGPGFVELGKLAVF